MESIFERKPVPAAAAATTGWTIGAGSGWGAGRGAAAARGGRGWESSTIGAGWAGVMVFTTGCWRSILASAVSAPGAFGSSGCSTIS